jgi:hypothetical protein
LFAQHDLPLDVVHDIHGGLRGYVAVAGSCTAPGATVNSAAD